MKSILYVGATLMIGASIYGFVDYKKNNNKKEFTRMYEREKNEPATLVLKEETTSKELSKKEAAVKEEVTIATENAETNTSKEEIITAKKNSKAFKKINYKFFSRAPLERRYLNKEIKIEEPKTIVEPDVSIQKNSPNEKKEQ